MKPYPDEDSEEWWDEHENPRPMRPWFHEETREGGRKVLVSYRDDHMDLLSEYWDMMMREIKSPIEHDLACEFFHKFTLDEDRYPFVVPSWQNWRVKFGYTIAPQMKVGPYTADFGIALTVNEPHAGSGLYSHDELPHSFSSRVIVECDGHEWHDKTKEQAARDKKRDRFLLEQGWPVMRFTGSEIHADAAGCAGQIIRTLKAMNDREAEDTRELRQVGQRLRDESFAELQSFFAAERQRSQ